MTVLQAQDLSVVARIGGAAVPVIRALSFELAPSKILGLVGESGAVKSMIGRAIAQLLPPGFEIAAGSLRFEGQDLVRMAQGSRRALLGRAIAFIPQAPMTALNPVISIGRQFDEHLARLGDRTAAERRNHALAMLAAARLPDAGELLQRYPHQLSGGMCQRVLIAMAPGISVKVASNVLGVSESTAKTHLQHIYGKTGTSKQTELLHLFMSSAPPVKAA